MHARQTVSDGFEVKVREGLVAFGDIEESMQEMRTRPGSGY
jgi:hypothetical protein